MIQTHDKIIHPLFCYLLAFAGGILISSLHVNHIAALSTTILFFCLTPIYYFKNFERRGKLKICMALSFFLLGFWRFHFWEQQYQKTKKLLSVKSDYIAQVIDINEYSHPFFKHKILLKLSSLPKKSANFYATIYLPKIEGIRIADHLMIKSLSLKPPKRHQESLYSNESLAPKIFACKLLFSIAHRPNFSVLRIIKETKAKLAKELRAKMSKTTALLFEYIFLGLKRPSDLADTLRDKFNYWGIAHYLARSGLHVVIIIFLWSLFLKALPLPFILKQCVLILLSFIYSFLSWPSTSFERALFTFLLVQLCLILKLPIRTSYLITLCSLIFLMLNPFYFFLLDFQLSFGLTLGIALFNEIQNKNR